MMMTMMSIPMSFFDNGKKIDYCRRQMRRRKSDSFVSFDMKWRNFDMIYMMIVIIIIIITNNKDMVVMSQSYDSDSSSNKKSIAIIGGGISGSFVTKYLVDYDIQCNAIDTITIFEPKPIHGPIKVSEPYNINTDEVLIEQQQQQGSRISTLQLNDGTIVELGASIGYNGFYQVIDMIRTDGTLEMAEPFYTGTGTSSSDNDQDNDNNTTIKTTHDGIAIYDGNNQWKLITTGLSTSSPIYKKLYMTLRYNWDLYKISILCKSFLSKWSNLPRLLNSSNTFIPQSPDEVWNSIHLLYAVHISFNQLLDHIGISKSLSSSKSSKKSKSTKLKDTSSSSSSSISSSLLSWMYWIPSLILFPFHGSIRDELLTAINLVNYNQNNEDVNGIVGMGSFAASTGGLFSIKNGNYQIIPSAFRQAEQIRNQYCHSTSSTDTSSIQYRNEKIKTVLGNMNGFTLYNHNNEIIGQYDIVILAVPIQFSNISFFIQSHFDSAVIQPMPLGGLLESHDHSIHYDSGRDVLPTPLPSIARRPYKQVTTTIISHANLTFDNNFLSSFPIIQSSSSSTPILPKTILMTDNGKYTTYNITSISYIQNGLYKIFSDQPLNETILSLLFGNKDQYRIEYVQVWGTEFGGATPDYQGQGQSTNFLLYDGATGLEGHTTSGAIYYPCSMEQSSLASMEIAAVGAKAVAKLIAKRFNILHLSNDDTSHDEL